MKTKLSSQNPFAKTTRLGQAFSWELFHELNSKGKKIVALDYGAYDGKMFNQFCKDNLVRSAISVDLNLDIVNANQNNVENNHSLIHILKGEKLPFEDEKFDVVTMIGVIEHVHDQQKLLDEIYRVTKKDGIFIVAVPGSHFFSFLDLGNWKFKFPKIHKLYIESKYGKEYYYKHYVECVNGLIGDVEVEKKWHEHFSFTKLSDLLNNSGFQVYKKDGFGFFYRLLHNVAFLLPFLEPIISKLILIDAISFEKAEIFVAAKKSSK